VGKAKNAAERLDRHLCEARTNYRPVHNWIRSLARQGRVPKLKVLETVPEDQWEEAERRLIAEYRKTCKLLNVADGGAKPACTDEQLAKAGRKGRKAIAKASPELQAVWRAKRDLTRLLRRFEREGSWYYVYYLRFMMRVSAADKPELYGSWATL
jgi:hypothetical protein